MLLFMHHEIKKANLNIFLPFSNADDMTRYDITHEKK